MLALTSLRMGSARWCLEVQVTAEKSENLNKRKSCSAYKLKEITGSGIFAANGEDDLLEPGSANPASNNKTGLKMYQVLHNIAVAEYFRDGCSDPRRLLEVLNNVNVWQSFKHTLFRICDLL
ncbi:uncharacterized protein LOC130136922 isoform X1 [Syzygium oleosum]|uniref:uncharacterized protein LOC130134673 isoform X1 n=2 Tax=Syzygium oleosum TaxID=219896 RepID=UPI0024B9DD1E|nr:uncharacterized protein LOC130134673 isoform X1 [Syzygium oleosum]XP_056163508.1 uncharacterized protein LOC130136922 isoform X1 [Syzygium oleosum]